MSYTHYSDNLREAYQQPRVPNYISGATDLNMQTHHDQLIKPTIAGTFAVTVPNVVGFRCTLSPEAVTSGVMTISLRASSGIATLYVTAGDGAGSVNGTSGYGVAYSASSGDIDDTLQVEVVSIGRMVVRAFVRTVAAVSINSVTVSTGPYPGSWTVATPSVAVSNSLGVATPAYQGTPWSWYYLDTVTISGAIIMHASVAGNGTFSSTGEAFLHLDVTHNLGLDVSAAPPIMLSGCIEPQTDAASAYDIYNLHLILKNRTANAFTVCMVWRSNVATGAFLMAAKFSVILGNY